MTAEERRELNEQTARALGWTKGAATGSWHTPDCLINAGCDSVLKAPEFDSPEMVKACLKWLTANCDMVKISRFGDGFVVVANSFRLAQAFECETYLEEALARSLVAAAAAKP